MKIHYLEIVTPNVDASCEMYEAAHGVSFGPPVELLGNARTSDLPNGGTLGIRAPMSEAETPVVRPYWLVPDIEQAVAKVTAAGGEVAHPPMELPGKGKFAICIQGGIQHGYWEL